MLVVFRNNQVSTALFLAVFVVLLRLPALAGLVNPDLAPVDGAGVLYDLLFGWAADTPRLSAIVSAILVFVQALLMNWLVNQSRVNPERNWLVPLLYVVSVSCVSDFQFLSPPLVAATLFPIVYRIVFKVYKSPDTTLITFDTGLLTAIAALFYTPAFWALPIVFLSILHLRAIKMREAGVFALGAFIPGFLGWSISFLNNSGGVFRQQHVLSLFQFWNFHLDFSFSTLVQAGFLALLLLIILLGYSTYYYKRFLQVQKYNNILYWLIFVVSVTILFRNQPQVEHFLLASTAAGVFLGLSFQAIKNKAIAEVLFIALLAVIFTGMLLNLG